MKSGIALALAALSFALTISACVAESDDAAAVEASEAAEPALAAAATPAQARVSADALGGPTTQTEYLYFRCSLDGALYTTRAFCLESCTGGTCVRTLICKNGQGQQIPCP